MTILTVAFLNRVLIGKPPAKNVNAIVDAVNTYGKRFGLDQPHRLAQFLAQVLHESGSLKYFAEIWGPTPAQKRYEGRRDLGNTHKGDGSKFRGYGPIQLTGRDNVTRFYKWCLSQGFDVPNFVDDPSKIATGEWAGLSAIWFWSVGNSTKASLNKAADRGDIESITKTVNGGLNGFEDRVQYYTRCALVMLGYGVKDVQKFQKDAGFSTKQQDGIAGPQTRSALHVALLKLTNTDDQSSNVRAAPVVTKETVEVSKPVVPAKVETEVKKKSNLLGNLTGLGGVIGTAGTAVLGANWQAIVAVGGVAIIAVLLIFLLRRQIVAAVREIRSEVANE